MKKAFMLSGGAGRVLCSIPAFEKYAKTDPDFIIICHGWKECFYGSPILRNKVYDINHDKLFEHHLRDREIITPEPYHLNLYFNQKVNLIQAFDIIINGHTNIPPIEKINIELSKKEQIDGYSLVEEVRNVKKKEKVIVFQPYGSSVTQQSRFIYDTSGRSFEPADAVRIVNELKDDYGIILMSQMPLSIDHDLGIAWPQNVDIRTWMGVINAADYFLGCDSLGQHIAYALGKPTTVVIGATYPENITYQDEKNFNIIDNGKEKRVYAPYRITHDTMSERINEDCMVLTDSTFNQIITSVRDTLGKPKIDLKNKL